MGKITDLSIPSQNYTLPAKLFIPNGQPKAAYVLHCATGFLLRITANLLNGSRPEAMQSSPMITAKTQSLRIPKSACPIGASPIKAPHST